MYDDDDDDGDDDGDDDDGDDDDDYDSNFNSKSSGLFPPLQMFPYFLVFLLVWASMCPPQPRFL